MNYVNGFVECPQCGGEMIVDRSCSPNEHRYCKRCGKRNLRLFEFDCKGNLMLDINNKPILKEDKETTGYGFSNVVLKNGASYSICQEKPRPTDLINTEISIYEDRETDKENTYFTTWDENLKEVQIIRGKLPKIYKEKEI